jgi:hypothetical protein
MINNPDSYTRPFPQFPTRGDHESRWYELAQAIASESDHITDDPEQISPPDSPGELVILGSGIEAVGFISSDEIYIREADYVFYCVADPATVVWLKAARPDAYDLYVLYDDAKVRYLTYMQMAEAMLYYVRRGKRVVAIFYGHPGIFVLSTHRAIQIARREGHRAMMRPGVSALDILCADLGVDPSQPGMQTFEATDMLIRRHRPDPKLHVVLWQVGLIGELGYRRQGCLNNNFSILLDYLEDLYEADQQVVNYVGSRYPGIDPLIQWHTIRSLRDPQAQASVTGISTFYLPPSQVAPADPEMLLKLGLLKPGQVTTPPESPLRLIDRYGSKERKAFEDFARFNVPIGYHWQTDTAAARFILALREDGELRSRYRSNPQDTVASWGGHLSRLDRQRLSARESGAMQVVAKGMRARVDPISEKLLRELLTQESTSRSLLRAVQRGSNPQVALKQWGQSHGYDIDWKNLPEDFAITLRQWLYPWTGCYLAKNANISIVLHGLPTSSSTDRVYLNGVCIQGARFHKGKLCWQAEAGNATSGSLQVDLTPRGVRRLVGAIWATGEELASHHQVIAVEHRLDTEVSLASLAGTYQVKSDAGELIMIGVSPGSLGMQITVNGTPTQSDVRVGAIAFNVDRISVPFSAFVPEQEVPPFACGEYRVRLIYGEQAKITSIKLDTNCLWVEDRKVPLTKGENRTFRWEGGPPKLVSGQLTVLIDPISLSPMLFGDAGSDSSTRRVLLRGMIPLSEAAIKQRASIPELAMPDWAWRQLIQITADASQKGGIFLWHGWVRSVNNLRRLRRALSLGYKT